MRREHSGVAVLSYFDRQQVELPQGAITARPHLPQLDALRAIAVAMVVSFHLYGETFKWGFVPPNTIVSDLRAHGSLVRWLGAPMTLGYAGVPLFFVLSGFCIHYATLRSRRRFSYGRFMWRRAWRIYPAYLAAIVFVLLIRNQPLGSIHHLRKTLLLHLAMLHNFFNNDIYELNPSFWTLPIEFQFYAIYPLFLWLRSKWGIHRATGLAFAVSVGLIGLMSARHLDSPKMLAMPLVSYGQWCLGALVAERFIDGRPILLKPWLMAVICLPLIALTSKVNYWEWDALLWAVLFAAVMDAWVRREARWLPRWVQWLGIISYSIYLLHQPIILRVLPYLHGGDGARFGKMVVIAVPVILVMSTASYYLFELPGIWIGHRLGPART